MKTQFLIILTFLANSIISQELVGAWTGYLKTPGSELPYELSITESNNKYAGYSMIIYPKDGVENIGVKTAKIKVGKNNILIEDDELVYDNFSIDPKRVKMYCTLTLTKKGSKLLLTGSFKTRSIDFRDQRTYEGEVYLVKSADPVKTKLLVTLGEIKLLPKQNYPTPTKKEAPAITKNTNIKPEKNKFTNSENVPVLNFEDRKIEYTRVINITGDSVHVSIYDNGVIDGDTVSVELNKTMIAKKIGLTAKAFQFIIPAKKINSDSLLLVMHAESLGLIPPNTGLIIIKDGNTQYEIRFSSDYEKSAAIILKRK